MAHWGGVQEHPFQHLDPDTQRPKLIPLARLDDGKTAPGLWDVWIDSGDDTGNRPLITRVRYGLGQIVYLPFSFEDPAFFAWAGREKFLQTMVHKLAPKAPEKAADFRGFGDNRQNDTDLATELVGKLDNFDVTVIPFGYVALFIVLYILVVGPLDYFLLKYVFKRLEWTWITFPSSWSESASLAYFTAYALKGNDLKINKIDIVDFDLRTSRTVRDSLGTLTGTLSSRSSARTSRTTRSASSQPGVLGREEPTRSAGADVLGWMGRPEQAASARDGALGLDQASSADPTFYAEDAAGLEGVPIPVWTTKTFTASWEHDPAESAVLSRTSYLSPTRILAGKDVKISGTLKNHLRLDLEDVWMIYDNRCFRGSRGL